MSIIPYSKEQEGNVSRATRWTRLLGVSRPATTLTHQTHCQQKVRLSFLCERRLWNCCFPARGIPKEKLQWKLWRSMQWAISNILKTLSMLSPTLLSCLAIRNGPTLSQMGRSSSHGLITHVSFFTAERYSKDTRSFYSLYITTSLKLPRYILNSKSSLGIPESEESKL